MKNKQSGFSGSLGFVLAAAGSAVGVGNIWRFPYLCAKDGFFASFITSQVSPHRVHAAVPGADGVGGILRRGKGH